MQSRIYEGSESQTKMDIFGIQTDHARILVPIYSFQGTLYLGRITSGDAFESTEKHWGAGNESQILGKLLRLLLLHDSILLRPIYKLNMNSTNK